ncbi:MAG: FGGY family carbohydrate kinase [Acidimicrobiales bacterium]
MPDDPIVLGLDVGTTSIKAVLLDPQGRSQAMARAATPFRGGEMAPSDLLSAARQVLTLLDAPDLARVRAVGIAGLAESGAALDGAGRPLGPIIAWNDPRGGEVVDRLMNRLGADLQRAIGQRLRTVSSVAKLGWLLDQGAGPVFWWLGVPELVLHALTGCRVTEFSLAARTGAYDVAERRYLPEVEAGLGLAAGAEVFPPVAAAGSVMGRVSQDGFRWSGLPAGIPVTLAGHDHLVGRVGAGVAAADLANSVGTAETVVAALPPGLVPDLDLAIEERVPLTWLPGGHAAALLASAARAGLVVAAVAQALGCRVDELDLRSESSSRHPGNGLHPHLGDRIIDAALAGQSLPVDAGQPPEAVWPLTVAALAARTWGAVDRLERVAATAGAPGGGHASGDAPPGARADRSSSGDATPAAPPIVSRAGAELVVYGGGSRSRLWLEAKARGRPQVAVWRSKVEEAVARGAALFAGVAAEWWPLVDAAPEPSLERITPRPPPPCRADRF